jgi:predicted GNAT family acetyltransferase
MAVDGKSTPVTDNAAESRFELQVEGRTAVLEYVRRGDAVVYVHTGVPPELEGRGIGGQLAKFALDDARTRGLKVVARCPYVAAYIERHPEYADLLASAS